MFVFRCGPWAQELSVSDNRRGTMFLFVHWDKQHLSGVLFCILQVKLSNVLCKQISAVLQDSDQCFDTHIYCKDLMTFLFYAAYFCKTETSNYA